MYWGHNALIRIKPFMEHCHLPDLPGKRPLGGPIMSQDIVEAALAGRAGWAVEWDVESGGSYDEFPPNILAYGKRDRRWCQGKCQHFWLIFGDGMKFGHRFYFGMGIFAYIGGPLLLILILCGFVQSLWKSGGLFNAQIFWTFIAFLLVLLGLPRALGLIRALFVVLLVWSLLL